MTEAAADQSVAAAVGEALVETDATVAVAESCTGGQVAARITDVSGSSEYFDRSLVTYANDAKQDLLAVTREALDEHGAVSRPVARQLARGIRDTADTTWGVSTTGIAGPTGGSPETPVGTVYIGIAYAGPWGTDTSTVGVERYEFEGDRLECKAAFARQALTDLLAAIEERR